MRRGTPRRALGLLTPLRGRILLAVLAGSGAALSAIGLIAALFAVSGFDRFRRSL